MSEEVTLREEICRLGESLFARGLTHGSTGNISTRCGDGWLLTPTGSNLACLDPARLAKLDARGAPTAGDPPTKETFLHLAMYDRRPDARAVVHLHSTYAVAVSVLADVNAADVLPPLTAYYVMRIGRLPLVPYHPPGDLALADAVRRVAGEHHAVLLANHGPVVAGVSLTAAADAIEELEATARLHLLLRHETVRGLTPAQVSDLRARFPS